MRLNVGCGVLRCRGCELGASDVGCFLGLFVGASDVGGFLGLFVGTNVGEPVVGRVGEEDGEDVKRGNGESVGPFLSMTFDVVGAEVDPVKFSAELTASPTMIPVKHMKTQMITARRAPSEILYCCRFLDFLVPGLTYPGSATSSNAEGMLAVFSPVEPRS